MPSGTGRRNHLLSWRRRAPRALLFASLLAGVGCGSADSTPPLFAAAELPVTLAEFRIRLNDYTEYYVAVIDEASGVIIDTSTDEEVRRRAMEFRLRAVNTFLNSLNQPDPVASLLDAWALNIQLTDFVSPDGAGAELFGDYQQIMIDATADGRAEIERLIATVAQRSRPSTATSSRCTR